MLIVSVGRGRGRDGCRRPRAAAAGSSTSLLSPWTSYCAAAAAGRDGSAALFAAERGWGLFNHLVAPFWLALVAVMLLDFGVWAQHLAMHKFAPLWRLHRVHQTGLDVDVTTGVRFHPFEILLSMIYKSLLVVGLGTPAVAAVVFEILLNASSLFTHDNLRLRTALDRALQLIVVTPDMHRVHHSVLRPETDSNYGFNLSIWDRLFGTYRAAVCRS